MNLRPNRFGIDICDHCADCKWRSDSFFCQFDPATMAAFDQISFSNLYAPGTILYAENEAPRGLFVLCSGQVKLSISSGSGKTLITRMVPAGEVLGLPSVMANKPYRSTAETVTAAQLKFVKREDFKRFMEEHREVSFNIARQLIEECESDATQIRSLGLANSAAERLANLLLAWSEESGSPSASGMRFPVLMTHEEISQLIGTSRETVTRLLKNFREKKILTVRRSSMTLHKKDALEELLDL
ncbi:MAG TPA: Crp/Fnr family transcriptional regulator [Thermoanaerobaculia bacterium]|nr:Crp/Fnr family transcriptional regulator [Thermoanaerobaculia bacterium]